MPTMNDLRVPLSAADFERITEKGMPRSVLQADPDLTSLRARDWKWIAHYEKLIRKNIPLQEVLTEYRDRFDEPELWQQLTLGQRIVVPLASFDGQVKNGGVAQFFWNCTGLILPVRQAFAELNMPNLAANLDRAVAVLREQFHDWKTLRNSSDSVDEDAWAAFEESYELLDLDWFDQAYFSLHTDKPDGPPSEEVITIRLMDYILAHRDEFIREPTID
jgi:hypothetical protein